VYAGITRRVERVQREIAEMDRREWFQMHYGNEKHRTKAELFEILDRCKAPPTSLADAATRDFADRVYTPDLLRIPASEGELFGGLLGTPRAGRLEASCLQRASS
jgi:hypothetical protein